MQAAIWACDMAQWIKALSAKPDDPSEISRALIVEEKKPKTPESCPLTFRHVPTCHEKCEKD